MREPKLTGADALRTAYGAKAQAELQDADALAGAAPGTWTGPIVGARIAFVVGGQPTGGPPGLLPPRVQEALTKAAVALGADADDVFVVTSHIPEAAPLERAKRLRLLLEAADPLAIIAIDTEAAEALSCAFGLGPLAPGATARAAGRAVGHVGDFAASLDDPAAKTRVWSAMKAVAAAAGLHAKGRPGTAGTSSQKPSATKAEG